MAKWFDLKVPPEFQSQLLLTWMGSGVASLPLRYTEVTRTRLGAFPWFSLQTTPRGHCRVQRPSLRGEGAGVYTTQKPEP